MDALLLICVALATWRIAAIVSQESGPADMFGHLRKAFGLRYQDINPDMIDDASRPPGSPAEFISCVACLSVWIAPCVLALTYAGTPGRLIIFALAVSAAATAFNKWINE